jgi:hypothetical protein
MANGKKKGFLHYLHNPAETAKKLFPFIDVDAMMEDNKKRYKALGVDPDKGKNLIGMALNPLAWGTGAVGGRVLSGIGSGIKHLGLTAGKSKLLPFGKAYENYSRRRIKKDLLSEAGFNRYKSNAISETKRAIEDTKRGLTLFDNPHVHKTLGDAGIAQRMKAAQGRLKSLNADLDFINMRGQHGFRDQYMKEISKSLTETPMTIGYPTPKGYIRGWSGYYDKAKKATFIDEANVLKPRFKGTGVHELKHAAQYQPGGNLTRHGWKDRVNRLLERTRIKDKMGIPTEYAGRAQAKLMDAVFPRESYKLSRKEFWDAIATPEEISARLSQVRNQPKVVDWLVKKNLYKPGYYKQLETIFPEGHKAIKNIAKDVWGVAPPLSFVDYTKRK